MTHAIKKSALYLFLLAAAGSAHAELGGNSNSVQTDQQNMQATLSSSASEHYTLHALRTPNGTTVREYVSSAGTVFAVGWDGPQLPNLQQLLGAYFTRYTDAAQQRTGRGPLLVSQPDLVVQSGGHMRSFAGRAYLPGQVPDGVAISTLQ